MEESSRLAEKCSSFVRTDVAQGFDPRFEMLEPRLLLSVSGLNALPLGNLAPDLNGLPDITVIEDGHLPDPGTTVDR